jgi:myosin heavy subunit
MHWGNQQWKQKPREEQAEADGTEHVAKVAKLLGLDLEPFVNGLLKPRIKVIFIYIFLINIYLMLILK